MLLFGMSVLWSEDPFARAEYFGDYVDKGARILVVSAHPDKSLAGPLLAYACLQKGNPCHIAVFTRGGGGTCGLLRGCKPDLEMQFCDRSFRSTGVF
jgi:hypothetical protein